MPRLLPQRRQEKLLSFYESSKNRLVQEFQRIKAKYNLSQIVLVLDIQAARIISSLFTLTQLVQHGLVFLERLEVARKRLDHHAIYLIAPSKESVHLMLKDFEQSEQYRKVHVLFTGQLDHTLLHNISSHKTFLKKIARHSFKEFYLELQIITDNCINMNIPYLPRAFSQDHAEEESLRMQIAKKMVHLVAGYDQLLTVRLLYDKKSQNKVAQRIVELASKEIKKYMLKLLDNKSSAIDSQAADLTIFVVDRSIDVVSPVIHGYAYQALLYDILNQNNEHSEQYQKLPKEIFDQYRYRHILHALEALPRQLDEVLAKINQKDRIDALQITKLLQEKESLNVHVQLVHRLLEKYLEKGLKELGELQLSLATGVTQERTQTSSPQLLSQIINQITGNKSITSLERIRLALLALSCIKLCKEDYRVLLELFEPSEQSIFTNLVALGVSYDKNISKSTKRIDKSIMDRARQLLQEKSIPSERFNSVLEITLPRLVELLQKDTYGQQRKRMGEVVISVQQQQDLLPRFDRRRLVCMMCGGLSPTQICNIRRNHQLDPIVLASDQIINPADFVCSLKKIDILAK